MRLVVAHCTVDYAGRLTAHLPRATRLIMVKADGCVAVHADGGAYKPLNWMNAPNTVTEGKNDEGEVVWVVRSPKGETLTITMSELLADSCGAIAPGLRLVRREFPTDIGPVDLLCRDEDGGAVAIEVKRRGEIDGVEQLARYLEVLARDPHLRPVRGVFVAQQIKPQAKVLAGQRDIVCVEVDYDVLRGIEPDEMRLF